MVITASGDLLPESGLAAGTVNVTGDNITLTSTSTGGEVGNPASPLVIQANSVPAANGGVLGGVVNVTARGTSAWFRTRATCWSARSSQRAMAPWR